MHRLTMAAAFISMLAAIGNVRADDSTTLDGNKVVTLTRFLEAQPLDKQAPMIRRALLAWEADSKDVVDVVCAGVIDPVPSNSSKYSAELLAQYIFGSGAHQLEVPADKGKLMPAQLAGVTSMLKAYSTLLATDKSARIPRFDALLQAEAAGSLPSQLEPLVIANCLPKPAGNSRFPWTFGMTKAQVSALDGYGPYRSFNNGDLETYNGVFDGHFENFQLFFRNDQMYRIGIYTYEGTDLTAATQAWGMLYQGMQRSFGSVETPGNKAPSIGDTDSMKTFATTARAVVEAGGKTQMAPLQQPANAFSFASFTGQDVQGTKFYYISLFFDPPHAAK